jgi:iron(III) transport system permease protein
VSSQFRWAGIALLALLVVTPLAGLGISLVDRPADPFTGEVSPLFELSAGVPALLGRSLALSLLVAIGAMVLGTFLAWVQHRTLVPRGWALLSLLPLAMPSYIVAATLRSSLSPGGWIGDPLGLPHMTGFWMAVLVLTVITAPLVQLIVGASLQNCSAAEEEAAATLGASPGRVFLDVTWPRLRPAVGFSGLIALLYAMSEFGAVAVLDVPVLTWRLYEEVQNHDVARASVLGGATLLALIPLFVAARYLRGGIQFAGVANVRPIERKPASRRFQIVTAVVLMLVLGIGVIIPVSTLVLWVWDGIQRSLEFENSTGAVLDTVLIASAGTVVTLLVAWLPAWVVAHDHRKGRRSAYVEDAVYLTSALPGVLLALGLMIAALEFTRPLGVHVYGWVLGTGLLLMLGYATRFVAEVYAPLRVGFGRLDPRQMESAAVLGAGRWKRFRTVLLPGVKPGVIVAVLIGFNAIVKELPVTLLLGGATGMQTLSFRVWDRYNESLWHDAGLAGLCLVGLALVSAVLTLRWRQNA